MPPPAHHHHRPTAAGSNIAQWFLKGRNKRRGEERRGEERRGEGSPGGWGGTYKDAIAVLEGVLVDLVPEGLVVQAAAGHGNKLGKFIQLRVFLLLHKADVLGDL